MKRCMKVFVWELARFFHGFPHVFEVALYRLYCNTSHVEFVWELNSNFTWILQKIVMDSGYSKSQWKEWNNVCNSLWWLVWFYHSSTQGGHSFIHREWAFVPRHVLVASSVIGCTNWSSQRETEREKRPYGQREHLRNQRIRWLS